MANGLVERLRLIVPEHLLLDAESGGVTIADPSLEPAWCHVSVDAVVEQEGDERELVETAAYSVLSTVQDFITEWVAEPWPSRGSGVALPGVAWDRDELHAWYGDRDAPAARLSPLRLDA